MYEFSNPSLSKRTQLVAGSGSGQDFHLVRSFLRISQDTDYSMILNRS